MTENRIDSSFAKSRPLMVFENVLFALCLCVIALRVILMEGRNPQALNPSINLTGPAFSLSISALLIFSFIAYLLWRIFQKRLCYWLTSMEIGICLFVLAAVAATLAASNKRAAFTETITFLAPMMMALLLVQILDAHSKFRLLLYVIVGLGVFAAMYCASQFFWTNEHIIAQYEHDPSDILTKLGIEQGSFQQMLFEHSLYSRDVRGFFTTGNSAGSFASLAFFAAVGLLIEKFKNFRANIPSTLVLGIATAICLFGLLITQSKGAIATSVIGLVIFIACLSFGNWLKAHKKTILIICLLLSLAAVTAGLWYGLTHGRLPGGNSMLVRWQYWCASARMYADHPLTGVGPGNFAYLYSHYKPPAALETVADPHNFILTILTQYGPLGLLGFLAAITVPLARIVLSRPNQPHPINRSRPVVLIALFCGIVACLIHNCIDFAIFEPAILTIFCATLACLVALNLKRTHTQPVIAKPSLPVRVLIAAAALVIFSAFLYYALIPVAKANRKIQWAIHRPPDAHQLLAQAAKDDPLDPTPLNLNGRLYLRKYQQASQRPTTLLQKAADSFTRAAERNHADFKNYQKLTTVYTLLADVAAGQKKENWLKKAFDNAANAVTRYPGSARLRIETARIAEQLPQIKTAIAQYEKAVEIEDAYRDQFRTMYPGRELFSRLGEDNYKLAKQKIEQLTKPTNPQ